MTKRTKALSISDSDRKEVYERDSYDGAPCCVCCGSPRMISVAHFIARSQGGLGIPENLVTLCLGCHSQYDHGRPEARQEIEWILEEYLQSKYPDWDRAKLTYQREGILGKESDNEQNKSSA